MNIRVASIVFSMVSLCSFETAAQGFGVYEQGACSMGRASAAVAEPCEDGSAIYSNPAGLVDGPGTAISGGGMLVGGSSSFTSDLNLVANQDVGGGVGQGYLQHRLTDDLAVGFGAYVPYGLSVSWPLDFEGRFLAYESKLQTFYFQPTVAYAVNDVVSIGGGVTIVKSDVDLMRHGDLAGVPLVGVPGGLTFGALLDGPTDFINTSLSASSATGVGANVGVIVKPHERLRVGARYLSKVSLDYAGDAIFTPTTTRHTVTKPNPLGLPVGMPLDPFVALAQMALQNQTTSTAFDMPAQFEVGLSVHATDLLTLFGDYHWVGWSAFDTVVLDFADVGLPPGVSLDEELYQGYQDTSAVRVGAEVAVAQRLVVRGGYFYNQAAAPDESVTPLLPDAARNHFTVGVGVGPFRGVTLDLAYQHVRHDDRRGRVVDPPSGLPMTALNSGVYRSRGNLVGFSVSYRR